MKDEDVILNSPPMTGADLYEFAQTKGLLMGERESFKNKSEFDKRMGFDIDDIVPNPLYNGWMERQTEEVSVGEPMNLEDESLDMDTELMEKHKEKVKLTNSIEESNKTFANYLKTINPEDIKQISSIILSSPIETNISPEQNYKKSYIKRFLDKLFNIL